LAPLFIHLSPFFFQAEDGIRDRNVTGVQTCALPISVADQPRTEAASAVTSLRKAGIDRIAMLTGDNAAAATHVASQVGITDVHAGLLPHDKARLVGQARDRGERVIMVGDGVNDAPALALADVGVAMGGAGTDVSQASADVILMTDRLDQLVGARVVARATAAVMRQNTAIALVTVVLLLAGVLARQVGLAGGMLVHELSVIAVVLNALRIVRIGRREKPEPTQPAPAGQHEPATRVGA